MGTERSRTRTEVGYGLGESDIRGGVAQTHPFQRLMFAELIREKREQAFGVLDREKKLVTLRKGQALTPTGEDTNQPAPLYFPEINSQLGVKLLTPNEVGTGKEVVAETQIDERHSVPSAAWFTGVSEGVVLPPSFEVVSAQDQRAWRLPPLAELLESGLLTPADGVALVTGASHEFSSWLRLSDSDDVTKDPAYRPIMVDTLTEKTWRALEARGHSRNVDARVVITPQSLGVEPGSAMAVRTRGQWFHRDAVQKAMGSRNIGGLEITPGQFRELLTIAKPFATIGGEGGKSGSTFIFENAALRGEEPPAVLIPMTAARVTTLAIGKDNLAVAARVLKDIQAKNAAMLQHIAASRLDLGMTDNEETSLAGQLRGFFNRLRGKA